MAETIYNKLVRDKIPEIIKKANKTPVTYIASELEAVERLYDKLGEEFEEFKLTPTAEELADILEVIDGIAAAFDLNMDTVQSVKTAKYTERGGFTMRIILDRVID